MFQLKQRVMFSVIDVKLSGAFKNTQLRLFHSSSDYSSAYLLRQEKTLILAIMVVARNMNIKS